MNGETRRILREDTLLFLVVGIAILLGCCHGAKAAEPAPMHSFGPPTPAAWSLTTGGPQRLGIVLSPRTWERALDSVELLPAVEAERDAAVQALESERAVSAALRTELAASRAEVATLRLSLEASRAETFRLGARSHRRGLEIAVGVAVGVLAGAAVSR